MARRLELHDLEVTRGHRAGPLPGQSLAILDPALMVVSNLIPCEDAHTQERALMAVEARHP